MNINPHHTLSLCVVERDALRAALEAGDPIDPAAVALDHISAPAADLIQGQPGWLPGIADESGAPVTLDHFVLAPQQAVGLRDVPHAWEVDAFALCAVYERVVWDDRAPEWHKAVGRERSHDRLRKIHDLSLRAWRNHGEGERLVILESP